MKKVKQFSELTFDEREKLRESLKLRALKDGTDLLENVRCVWVAPKENKEKK